MESKRNIYGILSFILGLAGLIFFFILLSSSKLQASLWGWLGFPIPFLGILFGAIQKDKGQTKLGKLGYALGIIMIFINLLYLFTPPF